MLLLDEPFAALDAITRAEMQQWLADALAEEPRTVLLVTHDVEEALFLADRVAVLSRRARAGWWPSSRCPCRARATAGRAVTDPALGRAARQRALEALRMRRVAARRRCCWPRFVGALGLGGLARARSTTSPSPRRARPWRRSRTTASLLLDNAWVTLVRGAAGPGDRGRRRAWRAALAMHLSRTLRDAAYPLLVASQAIPIVVLAPIFVLAFDYGIGPKLAIVALICFFPITVGVLDGLRSVDPEQLKLMRSFGASRAARRCAAWSCPPRCRASSAACASPPPCR